jgi:hypothetical protein
MLAHTSHTHSYTPIVSILFKREGGKRGDWNYLIMNIAFFGHIGVRETERERAGRFLCGRLRGAHTHTHTHRHTHTRLLVRRFFHVAKHPELLCFNSFFFIIYFLFHICVSFFCQTILSHLNPQIFLNGFERRIGELHENQRFVLAGVAVRREAVLNSFLKGSHSWTKRTLPDDSAAEAPSSPGHYGVCVYRLSYSLCVSVFHSSISLSLTAQSDGTIGDTADVTSDWGSIRTGFLVNRSHYIFQNLFFILFGLVWWC